MNINAEIANAKTAADLLAIWPKVNEIQCSLVARRREFGTLVPKDFDNNSRKVINAWMRKAKPLAGFESNEKPVSGLVVYMLQNLAK